jgi:spore germination protein KA/spore germination protein
MAQTNGSGAPVGGGNSTGGGASTGGGVSTGGGTSNGAVISNGGGNPVQLTGPDSASLLAINVAGAPNPENAVMGKPISETLSDNVNQIRGIFTNCSDLEVLPWHFGPDMRHAACSIYFSSLVQHKPLNYFKESLQDLVTHIVGPAADITPEQIASYFDRNIVSAQSAQIVRQLDQALLEILIGKIVIFVEKWSAALVYSPPEMTKRQVAEPISEPVVQGPRESTVESLQKNLGMLRERIKSPHFKVEMFAIPSETKTRVAYCYLEGAVNPEMLAEFKRRIGQWRQGEILETAYIEELLEDNSLSPFPQFRYTERTDTAAAALLDGKIVVLVEGTGSMLICPGLFVELLQSSEDYYQRTVFSSLIRLLRFAAMLIALSLPSVYIALSTFHPELIPTVLLLAIIDTREGIPFPAFVEAVIMEFFFELLREAGIRLPRPVGSAVSIVGALVIGEAAINAGIASPIMVVVVALTGIASFAIPQYNFAIALRILRFPLMVFAGLLGGFGLMIAFLLILLHLSHLRSLGQPYLSPLAPFRPKQMRDVVTRVSLKNMLRSPRNLHMRKQAK